eukprot:TRINITY_DN2542_c0_g2_i1.p1 TRINITY_DN2542_c0_g2~~TRINITY_DN2542_c0_g2_i1.p1  ORF type:complete len:1401 (-),score=343.60 TRINITY_DN2542_c0_g2_i1:115-4317(-)
MGNPITTFFGRKLVGGIFGGLFFDGQIERKYLANVIHLYLFIFLLVFPLVLSWNLPFQQYSAYLEFKKKKNQSFLFGYVISLSLVFILIKLGNYCYRKFVKWSDEERRLKRKQRRLKKQGEKKKKKEESARSTKEIPLENKQQQDQSPPLSIESNNGSILVAPSDLPSNGKEEDDEEKGMELKTFSDVHLEEKVEKQEEKDEEIEEDESDKSDGELSEGEIEEVKPSVVAAPVPPQPQLNNDPKGEVFEYVDEFGEVQHYVMYNEEPEIVVDPSEVLNPLSNPRASSESEDSTLSSFTKHLLDLFSNDEANTQAEPIPEAPPLPSARDSERIRGIAVVPVTVNQPAANVDAAVSPASGVPVDGKLLQKPSWWKRWRETLIQQRRFVHELLDASPLLDTLMAIFFALMTAYIGWRLTPFYKELSRFMLWFVVACAQYSLLKSPQPDPSSSRQDFNRLNAFSRSFYFCFIGGIILILDRTLDPTNDMRLTIIELYGVNIKFGVVLETIKTIFIVFIPWYPLIHIFGLLPQIDTFVMYFAEQINIHVFGSSGSSNIVSSLLDLFGSCFIVGITFLAGYYSKFERSVLFSVYLALIVGLSFLQSRIIKDPYLWMSHIQSPMKKSSKNQIHRIPSFWRRLLLDCFFTALIIGVVIGLSYSTFFLSFGRSGFTGVGIAGIVLGLSSKWIIGSLSSAQPFGLFRSPFFVSAEIVVDEPPNKPAQVMWFEKVASFFNGLNASLTFPALFLISASLDRQFILDKFSAVGGTIILSFLGIRIIRGAFTDSSRNWLILLFTLLFFRFDAREYSEFFLLDYFLSAFFVNKIFEILEKTDFVVIYMAPWNPHWGSLFHGAVQPFTIPHVPFFIFQILYSALVSVPMYPLLGSSAFFASWARPVRFWERSYNSNIVDNSQRKLASALNNDFNPDNLNSIFYEHLMVSLRSSLQESISLGRLGNVNTGDFFLIMNDKLTAILHIIEIGNGFCTFQVRGMEFKGTYCHERELERITKERFDDDATHEYKPWSIQIPGLLDFKDWIGRRWKTWETINHSLMLQTYSISPNPIMSTIYSNDARKLFVKFYVSSTIYYLITNKSFDTWLNDAGISSYIESIKDEHVDRGSSFASYNDLDYDRNGVTFKAFKSVYESWINFCVSKVRKEECSPEETRKITIFCMMMSFVCRRAFFPDHCPNNITHFLDAYNTIFKGDIRITHSTDEWILSQVELVQKVVAKAARMTLKLHLDQFIEDFEENENLWDSLESYDKEGQKIVCCHESDPLWRQGIFDSVDNLISLRTMPNNSSEYQTISLVLRYMKFRVVRLNKECVRGLWAGQVQELVFFGNTNSERGSIQRQSAVVRNLINQSCDVPIGYPVYVSPLMVSSCPRTFWLKDVLLPDTLWKKMPSWITGEKKK